jgi:hypothetical protein
MRRSILYALPEVAVLFTLFALDVFGVEINLTLGVTIVLIFTVLVVLMTILALKRLTKGEKALWSSIVGLFACMCLFLAWLRRDLSENQIHIFTIVVGALIPFLVFSVVKSLKTFR